MEILRVLAFPVGDIRISRQATASMDGPSLAVVMSASFQEPMDTGPEIHRNSWISPAIIIVEARASRVLASAPPLGRHTKSLSMHIIGLLFGRTTYPGTYYSGAAISLQASGGSVMDYSGIPDRTTTPLTYSFTATSDSTTLTFMNISGFDSNAGWIDNVSLVAVPEPVKHGDDHFWNDRRAFVGV